MCLINVEVKEVTEDIGCYKVYLKQNNTLISPYRRSLAPEFNTVAKTDLGEIHKEYVAYDSFLPSVHEGFHSFANFYDAMKEAESWFFRIPVVVKCIIPKGAKCYVGQFNDKVSYCSDSIKLVKIC